MSNHNESHGAAHKKDTTMNKIVLGVVAFIVALALVKVVSSVSQDVAVNNISMETDASDHIRGDMSAPITLVEFGDYQCPACGAFHPLIKELLDKNPTRIKFVYKHFPLTTIHQNALVGARAAEAAGKQGKYFEMHDLLYEKQSEWSTGLKAAETVTAYAATLGLDVVKFESDMKDSSTDDVIKADLKEGTGYGITGTPALYANGKKLEGIKSYADLEAAVLASTNVLAK